MVNSNDVIREARNLKAKAMDARDLEEWDEAQALLQRAEELLTASLKNLLANPDPNTNVDSGVVEFRAQIANIRGSRGGVYRRQKEYEQAVLAYDAGSEMERLLDSSDRPNSYNLVQRLMARAFFDPGAVDKQNATIVDLPFRQALQDAEDEVRRQIRVVRGSDAYAWADLFQVLILANQPRWQPVLEEDFLKSNSLDRYSLEVTLEVIEQLCARADKLAAALLSRLRTAIKLLERKLSSLNSGQRRLTI